MEREALKTTRTVTRDECPWLDADVPEGAVVYPYHKCTYGCISPSGKAVSVEIDTSPFFELPREALTPHPTTSGTGR